jgi:hypothetical protein
MSIGSTAAISALIKRVLVLKAVAASRDDWDWIGCIVCPAMRFNLVVLMRERVNVCARDKTSEPVRMRVTFKREESVFIDRPAAFDQ